MPSLKQLLGDSLSGGNYKSPGVRFGLMFDPLAYLLGDKYRNFIMKTGDTANKLMSKAAEPTFSLARKYEPIRNNVPEIDAIARWAENKPASTTGLLLGAYFGAGAAGVGGAGAGGEIGASQFPGGFSGANAFGGTPAAGLPNLGGTAGINPIVAGSSAVPSGSGLYGAAGAAASPLLMPPPAVPPVAPPPAMKATGGKMSYEDEARKVARRRRLAEALQMAGMQGMQGQQAGRYYVAPSKAAGIASALSTVAGGYLGGKAGREEDDLRSDRTKSIGETLAAMTGTNAGDPNIAAALEFIRSMPLEQQEEIAGQASLSRVFPKKPEPYTMGPGDRRFEGGREIASVPDRPKEREDFTIGDTRYAATGKPIVTNPRARSEGGRDDTTNQRDFLFAQKNGYKGTFEEWVRAGQGDADKGPKTADANFFGRASAEAFGGFYDPINQAVGGLDPEKAKRASELAATAARIYRSSAGRVTQNEAFAQALSEARETDPSNDPKPPAGVTPAPPAALEDLRKNPQLRETFRQKYRY